MPAFGGKSEGQLITCDDKLIFVARKAIIVRDFSVIEGHRIETLQNHYFDIGTSKLRWPEGEHNDMPSRAYDLWPYPSPTKEDWENREYWIEWSSWYRGFAAGVGVVLISGMDWDNDYDLDDQKFHDGPHFHLGANE